MLTGYGGGVGSVFSEVATADGTATAEFCANGLQGKNISASLILLFDFDMQKKTIIHW